MSSVGTTDLNPTAASVGAAAGTKAQRSVTVTSDVKHVFVIHSLITLVACKAVMSHLGLSPSETVIIAERGFGPRLSREFPDVWDTEKSPAPRLWVHRRFWRTWRGLRKFDKVVSEKLRGKPYRLYLPHSMRGFYELLATHPLCRAFNYFEEGLVAYRSVSEMQQQVMLAAPSRLQQLALRGRRAFAWPFDNRAEYAYGLTSDSFRTTGLNVITVEPDWHASEELGRKYHGALICVLTPAQAAGSKLLHTAEQYYWMLLKLSRLLRQLDRRILLRFHPEQAAAERCFIEHGIFADFPSDMTVLDDDESIESICASADVDLLHGRSSLGVYAHLLGRRVYTYFPLMAEIAPKVLTDWEQTRAGLSIQFEELDVRELLATNGGSRATEV